DVAALDLGGALVAFGARHDARAATLQGDAFGIDADADALALDDLAHRVAHIRVLACDEARRHLDHGDAAAETAEHLAELEPDVAPAHYQQVFGQEVHVHHRLGGEDRDTVADRERRLRRARAHVDEDHRRGERLAAHRDGAWPGEARFALHHRHVPAAAQPFLEAAARVADDLVLARLDAAHVDAHLAGDVHAVRARRARRVRRAGARHQRLGGRAAVVHARAAELRALDDAH